MCTASGLMIGAMNGVPVAASRAHHKVLSGRWRANRDRDRCGLIPPFCLSWRVFLSAFVSCSILPPASIRGAFATHSIPGPGDGGTLPVRGILCWIGATAPRSHCPSALLYLLVE